MPKIIILSGRIASGKSTLAEGLARRHGFSRVQTRALIKHYFQEMGHHRDDLQAGGEHLDKQTNGRWVAEALADSIREDDLFDGVIVDSVRIIPQVTAIRAAFGDSVFHIHLTAPEPVLRERFETRRRSGDRSWDEASADPTERGVESLTTVANIAFDTDALSVTNMLDQIDSRFKKLDRRDQST